MKYISMLLILIALVNCKNSSSSPSTVAPVVCPTLILDDFQEAIYSGQVVTTSGNCGETYTIHTEIDYNILASITGWRLSPGYLETLSGNKNFTSGGRWQTVGSIVNEGGGLSFAGIDHTTCQNAFGVNGSIDYFVYTTTAEYDSSCNIRLRGTFREYSLCVNSSEAPICSGTFVLIQ